MPERGSTYAVLADQTGAVGADTAGSIAHELAFHSSIWFPVFPHRNTIFRSLLSLVLLAMVVGDRRDSGGYTPLAGALAVPECKSQSFVLSCARLRFDLLAGPAVPNGLVSHLEML